MYVRYFQGLPKEKKQSPYGWKFGHPVLTRVSNNGASKMECLLKNAKNVETLNFVSTNLLEQKSMSENNSNNSKANI
jgi:hypothetical protein